MNGQSEVECSLYVRYAGEDLDRWRMLIGCEVAHVDPRWGVGRVEDVRWGTPHGQGASAILIHTRYAKLGAVVFRAASFEMHHRTAVISAEIRRVIRLCFEGELDETEREAILEQHTRDLREAKDAERLARSDRLRRQAIERRSNREKPN